MSPDELLFDFEPSSLYLTAVCLMDLIHPILEIKLVFTKDVNDQFVKRFNRKTFESKIENL